MHAPKRLAQIAGIRSLAVGIFGALAEGCVLPQRSGPGWDVGREHWTCPGPTRAGTDIKDKDKAMKMTLHGTWLAQLTRFPNVFPVNCYLVREDDGFTLIDAALPGSTHHILAAARMLGAPIVRIALRHARGDYVGSLDSLHAALSGVESSFRSAKPAS